MTYKKMNRNISFRAWNSNNEEWDYFTLKDLASGQPQRWFSTDIENTNQYTGLKDKNGIEIYEGDVLQFEGLKPLVIEWQGGENKDYNYGWNFGRNDGEVIGNIYENPEFLK